MALSDDVKTFIEFTGCQDARTAEDFVKGNSKVEVAVEAFFMDPDPRRFRDARSWTDASFAAGKDGAKSQMDELPPYQMDEDDREGRTQLRLTGAPSRPPSRDKSRMSLRSGREVGTQQYGPFLPEQEDAELAEAIRLSMGDQTTGTVGVSGLEYVPDVEPQERVRQPGEPAFLKPLPSNVFLPVLFTILHSIPQCREIFLSRYDLLFDYGENKRWWEGEAIETVRVTDMESDDNATDQFQLIHEVQRLVAFLDVSDRAYASAASLARIYTEWSSQRSIPQQKFARFLQTWQIAAERSKTAYTVDAPFQSSVLSADGSETQNIYSVDIPGFDIPSDGDKTLYDVLDECFWPNMGKARSSDEVSLGHVAPVMVMSMEARAKTGPTRLIVPATLYADRYMETSKSVVEQMRSELTLQFEDMERIEEQLGKYNAFQHPSSSKAGNASKLMDAALGVVRHQSEVSKSAEEVGEQNADAIANTTAKASEILARLEQIHKELRSAVNSIAADQARIKANIKKLGNLLTDPNVEEGPKPSKEYKLRGVGVATSNQSHTIYLIYPPEPNDLIEFETPSTSWWRISYDTAGDKALISKEQVSEETVLNAAGELLYQTLLVYATPDMLKPGSDEPLPQPLQEFVALDNAAFRNELQGSPPPVEILEGHSMEIDAHGTIINEIATPLDHAEPHSSAGYTWNGPPPPRIVEHKAQLSSNILDPTMIGDAQTGAEPLHQGREMQEVGSTSLLLGSSSGLASRKRHADGFDGGDEVDGSDTSTLVEVSDNEGDVEMSEA